MNTGFGPDTEGGLIDRSKTATGVEESSAIQRFAEVAVLGGRQPAGVAKGDGYPRPEGLEKEVHVHRALLEPLRNETVMGWGWQCPDDHVMTPLGWPGQAEGAP